MFRKAYSISTQYTLPIVLSRKTIAGDCSSAIGAFVVVNKEGWIVTANHIVDQLNKLVEGEKTALSLEAQRKVIELDTSIDAKERRHRLQKLRKLGRDDTHRASAWWGGLPNTRLVYSVGIGPVDIAVGKLEPFDPAWIGTYPIFKDPSKEFEPGTSLCKLGFPFHSIKPSWNEATQIFELPQGTVPLPRFPIDGIFTRTAILQIPPGATFPFPLQWVETSTPGLKGQSGGPIFDVNGTIWAIQCQTMHLPLGFDPPVPGGRMGEKEHQFLNLGVGAHPETLFGLFKQEKIAFQISDY